MCANQKCLEPCTLTKLLEHCAKTAWIGLLSFLQSVVEEEMLGKPTMVWLTLSWKEFVNREKKMDCMVSWNEVEIEM